MKKSILITGCSSGIGLCAAHLLQARGWQGFASARDAADVERGRDSGMKLGLLDRLALDAGRLAGIADSLREVAALPDPQATVNHAAQSMTEQVRRLRPEEMHRINLVGRGGLGAPG